MIVDTPGADGRTRLIDREIVERGGGAGKLAIVDRARSGTRREQASEQPERPRTQAAGNALATTSTWGRIATPVRHFQSSAPTAAPTKPPKLDRPSQSRSSESGSESTRDG